MPHVPPAFPAGPCRGPDAKKPLKLHPPCTCAACLDRAVPCAAWLRAAAADCRGALETPPAPRARGATGGRREDAPRACPGGVLPRERR